MWLKPRQPSYPSSTNYPQESPYPSSTLSCLSSLQQTPLFCHSRISICKWGMHGTSPIQKTNTTTLSQLCYAYVEIGNAWQIFKRKYTTPLSQLSICKISNLGNGNSWETKASPLCQLSICKIWVAATFQNQNPLPCHSYLSVRFGWWQLSRNNTITFLATAIYLLNLGNARQLTRKQTPLPCHSYDISICKSLMDGNSLPTPLPCRSYLFPRFEICVMATLRKQKPTTLSHLSICKIWNFSSG